MLNTSLIFSAFCTLLLCTRELPPISPYQGSEQKRAPSLKEPYLPLLYWVAVLLLLFLMLAIVVGQL